MNYPRWIDYVIGALALVAACGIIWAITTGLG